MEDRSKKSKVRARVASCWTASGERSSTAETTDSTLPRLLPSTWLPRRSTAITSATSLSTAATTSLVDTRSCLTSRSRRLRDSASAGKASSASKAAVRRRPWPSLWRRWTAGVSGAVGCSWIGSVMAYRNPCSVSLEGAPLPDVGEQFPGLSPVIGRYGRMIESVLQSRIEASERLVTAEHFQGLENPWRYGGSGHRDPYRLEDVLGLRVTPIDHIAERAL